MAMFVVIPFALLHHGLDRAHHWQVYLLRWWWLCADGLAIIYGEKRQLKRCLSPPSP